MMASDSESEWSSEFDHQPPQPLFLAGAGKSIMVDWGKAIKDGSIQKLKIAELKDYLKKNKQPQTGEKEDLVKRISLHVSSRGLDVDGTDPFELKPAELRKACAQRGLNPMGERDELLALLIPSLQGGSGGSGGGSAVSGGSTETSSGDIDGVTIAKKVLELEDDHCGILSLLGVEINQKSSAAAMKKQYLMLSRLIHPDKLPGFGQATKAFQLLVSAYESLSQPDVSKMDTSKAKTKTINRSNEGCYRTQIFCPRCKAPWGEAVDGLEPAAYSHLMTGIKSYCCSTCLLDFGCMTAIHKCPFCRRPFDYSPDDYHRKITCGNKGCSKEFGFMLYNVSESRLKDLREELKSAQEKRIKRQEALDRRNARAQTKGAVNAAETTLKQDTLAFKLGLHDVCPRCGFQLGKDDGEEEAQAHLKECTDKAKIDAYQRTKAQEKAVAEARAKRRDAQDEVQGQKTWEFLGGENEQLWLLSVESLRKQCAKYEIDETGDKDELIARLVRHRNALDSSRLLTDGSTGKRGSAARAKPTHLTLPSNLESLSISQLKSVAASHGIVCKGTTKADIVAEIEKERFRDEPQLRLTMTAEHEEDEVVVRRKRGASAGGRGRGGGRAAGGRKRKMDSDDEDEVSDDSDEYVPEGGVKKGKGGGGRSKQTKKRKGADSEDDDDYEEDD